MQVPAAAAAQIGSLVSSMPAVPPPAPWFMTRDGKKYGPFTDAQLKQFSESRQLLATDLLWKEGMDAWKPAPALRDLFPQAPQVQATANTLRAHATPQTTTWWMRLLAEFRETVTETVGQIARLVRNAKARRRQRLLKRASLAAQLNLSQKMVQVGVGDLQLRSQIATQEQRIREAETAKRATNPLIVERDKLLLKLAAAALAQQKAALGTEADFAKARAADNLLRRHVATLTGAKVPLPPADHTTRRRVLVGFGAVGAFCVVIMCLMCGGTSRFFAHKGKSGGGPNMPPSDPVTLASAGVDFSHVDYSIDFSKGEYALPDFSKLDYSKGPQGQQLQKHNQAGATVWETEPLRDFWTVWERYDWSAPGAKPIYAAHGTSVVYFKRGDGDGPDERRKREEMQWYSGKKHGKARRWAANGQLVFTGFFVNDKPHGPVTEWHDNGQVKMAGTFKNGKTHGKWCSWYPNGQQDTEEFFLDGLPHGVFVVWEEDGIKHEEAPFVMGLANGRYTEWYPNGNKAEQGHFKNGFEDGVWNWWYEDAKPRRVVDRYVAMAERSIIVGKDIRYFPHPYNTKVDEETVYDDHGRLLSLTRLNPEGLPHFIMTGDERGHLRTRELPENLRGMPKDPGWRPCVQRIRTMIMRGKKGLFAYD
jgi:antitoxin component YwqK of YwqJK toxin-antitoxin module